MLTQQRILRPNHCATFVLLIRVCVTLKIYCTQNKVKKVLSVAADCSYVCTQPETETCTNEGGQTTERAMIKRSWE